MSQLTNLWHYLYSSPNFVPSVVGVAAAFAGSWGAQVAILRRDQRKELLATLRAVNEAQALCFAIGNTFMSLKKQHLIGMLERFRETEKSFLAFLEKLHAAEPDPQIEKFHCQTELHTLPISKVPIERLEAVVFEKLSLDTKTLNLVIEINKGIDALNTSIAFRNELVRRWYEGPAMSHDEVTIRYLGVHTSNGADETYKQTLFAIEIYCNDCIFFSMLLSKALNEHGNTVRRNRYRVFRPLPKIAEADYSSEKAQRLIPDSKEYDDWLSGFQPQPTFGEKFKAIFSLKVTTRPKNPEA
ncbi:hypothetical protein FJ986_00190 [Mesorhizobium sp. B1-1-1]|uniref:hypothetical protein n=1 Tax=Mesorhizobium sp. B1-1-1 TaxID=2589983 RepID=UPI00112D759C|nr:hypothetical protein [Mesorhizobium sp. B1-1-1]TPN70688.1 hypothetical protein FJ986_00190 [Mesorhizobium sp. B1-1-1]